MSSITRSLLSPKLYALSRSRRVCGAILLLAAAFQSAGAQQIEASAPPAAISLAASAGSPAPSGVPALDERYRIGPGDVIEVRVFRRPELSREAVRVDAQGMIRMPLINQDIHAACRTEGEIAREIADNYKEYLLSPQVDVFVKEYQSQPVAVIGAVTSPGRFQLQRRMRLLDLLAYAGGPAERAGTIQVVHSGGTALCGTPAVTGSDDTASTGFVSYRLKDTLRGDVQFNPYIQPGDIVTLPEADEVYVVGNVLKPTAIALREPITVSRAIAIAGGTLRDTKTNRVRIVRQMPGSATKTEIYVDLKAIDKRQAEDVALQPNDVVDVPTAGGRAFIRSMISAIVPATVSTLPYRIIP